MDTTLRFPQAMASAGRAHSSAASHVLPSACPRGALLSQDTLQ